MILYDITLKCCKRPWGVFSEPKEVTREVESLVRCHEGYFKTEGQSHKHRAIVEIIAKPAATWSDIYSGRA